MSLRREHKDKKTYVSAICGKTKSGLVPVHIESLLHMTMNFKKKFYQGKRAGSATQDVAYTSEFVPIFLNSVVVVDPKLFQIHYFGSGSKT